MTSQIASTYRTHDLSSKGQQIQRVSNLLRLTRDHWELPDTPTQQAWTQHKLQKFVQRELQGVEIFLLSQSEPYVHHDHPNGIQLERPAGGLVTALEPVMSACAGTWIAHGSGSADWRMVSKSHHINVPPEDPVYTLRRLKLSDDEMTGHYLGLCNQALWPLCNHAHVRPIFRGRDWQHYEAVNQRFSHAVVQEAKTHDPLILVQDYHLALVPQMVRELLPQATIATFWHIPWPHPKAFAICPWREQLLKGLMGSDVLGFQTTQHTQNFADTVAQFMGEEALQPRIKAYPISIAWPCPEECVSAEIDACRETVLQTHGLNDGLRLGVGVDRLDYVKGILERFLSIERLLEREPEWIDRFTFIQILSPSRLRVPEYRAYRFQIKRLADRINRRFGNAHYQPIVLVMQGQTQKQVYRYYRASDFCFVSSLDDGMNLVAKEFVASRDDFKGVLVLSQFAGAAYELSQALMVNPYDADACAQAISEALTMPKHKQTQRMQAMRHHVAEHNVYRWAGRLLGDAAKVRQHRALTHDARA